MTQLPSLNEAEAAVLRWLRTLNNQVSEMRYFDQCCILMVNPYRLINAEFVNTILGKTKFSTKYEITDAGRLALAKWEAENQK